MKVLLNIFDKSLELEYQKEFRFYVENHKIEPIKVHVGSLMDISEMFMIQDIEKLKIKEKINYIIIASAINVNLDDTKKDLKNFSYVIFNDFN